MILHRQKFYICREIGITRNLSRINIGILDDTLFENNQPQVEPLINKVFDVPTLIEKIELRFLHLAYPE